VTNKSKFKVNQERKSMRLVQYNVEWLFIEHYSNFDCPGKQCTWKNHSHALNHLNDVANIISTLKPDIINLCEVEGCNELNLIVEQLDSSYKPYLKFGTDVGTGQNVGMISKITPTKSIYRIDDRVSYPLEDSKCGYTGHSDTTGLSKHYITEFKLNNMNIAFIGTHLIAYPLNPARCAQREAQAQLIQNIVNDFVEKNYEVIVLGDMNDFDGEILDMNSNMPISRTLDIIKGNAGSKLGKYKLTNVASLIPNKERYSDWWDSDNDCSTSSIKDYSMIDHALVTENLVKYIKDVYIYHGYNEYCDKIHSDHFPVVVDFDFEI
jgi:exonuclease III